MLCIHVLNYHCFKMLATLPAIVLLDSLGRRPLLISGAAGCFTCLAIVGSLVTVYGKDWPAHTIAARIAIGRCAVITYRTC
jgi:hypothetical protein